MIDNKIQTWWKNLTSLQQVLITFFALWILSFGIKIGGKWFAGDDNPSIESKDFAISFLMAIIMTLSYEYYKIKKLIFPRSNKTPTNSK